MTKPPFFGWPVFRDHWADRRKIHDKLHTAGLKVSASPHISSRVPAMKTRPPLRLPRSLLFLLLALPAGPVVQAQESGSPSETTDAAAATMGRQVYEAKCVSCHGPNGIGTAEVVFPSPIFGDRATAI